MSGTVTTAGTTSGTVLGYPFNVSKVMDHAFRRAGYSPQEISSEWVEIARDLLFLQLSEYVNFGFPLWTRQQLLLPVFIGSPKVPLPYGTVDVFHTYWRRFNPWRSTAVDTNGVDRTALCAGAATADVGIVGPNPGIIVHLDSNELDTIGILPAPSTGVLLDGNGNPILDGNFNPILATPGSYSAALTVQTSTDGLTYTTVQTLPTTTFVAGQWAYFDLEPSIKAPYVQVVLPGTAAWMLSQVNFCLANSQQTELGNDNMDDHYSLPNKFMQGGQPNEAFVDRIADSPVIRIWPTPNEQAFYNGTVVALARRYIQDPGSLTNSLEIPARWLQGVIARLGIRLMDELPNPTAQSSGGNAQAASLGLMSQQQRRTNMETDAAKAEAGFSSEERSRSPIRITPNLSPYTR